MQQFESKKITPQEVLNRSKIFFKGKSLESLIYLTIFLLPLYLVKVQLFFVRTNILEILIGLVILWWLGVFCRKEKIGILYSEYKKYLICIAVMFSGLFLAAISNDQMLQSLSIIKSWFFLPVAFALIAADIIPREKIKNIFLVYGGSSFLVALIALGYWFFGLLTYDRRLEAFFNSPNYLAMYLAPGVILGFWLLASIGHKKIKTIFLGVLLIALFFTYSYAAFVAICLSSFWVLWTRRREMKAKHGFPKELFVIILIFSFFFIFQINNNKFTDVIGMNPRSSLASRVMIWQASWRIAKDNPLLGIGAANFQKTYLAYQKFFPPYLEWAVPHPQNLYLAVWLSGGILGLGGFFGILFLLSKDLLKKKHQNSLEILALGILFYILLHGLVDTPYFKNDLAVVFWLNFVVLKNAIRTKL